MFKYLFIILLILSSAIAENNSKKLIKIAIIDTGLNLEDPRFKFHLCKEGHTNYTRESIEDKHGHGTHVAGTIVENAGNSNFCLVILKHVEADGLGDLYNYLRALNKAVNLGVDIVNISGGGTYYSEIEKHLIKTHPNILFIAAVGNENKNIEDFPFYPASYFELPNVIRVGSLLHDGKKAPSSNFSKNMAWEVGDNIYSTLPDGKFGYMSGSSMATGVKTGKMVRKLYENSNIKHY